MNRTMLMLLALCTGILANRDGRATDWPMWRANPQRTAASSGRLPDQLQLIWKRSDSSRQQAWDDPLNLDLMTYDRVFEPIVMDGRLFVGFNDQDKLVAFDTKTGKELWSFFAEGPVRLPPVGWNGHVYFCSDDGRLYCVDASNGQLSWQFRGAPSEQHAIGNQRLTSAWPARGGPVVRDGTVYFAASIWPMMGTFLYALDADTGTVQWVNDSTSFQYIKQPHSAPSFAGVAPQGALVATADALIVPGGRSVPAVFDRQDGTLRYFEINAGGKGTGGSFVTADDRHFYVHTRQKGTRAFLLDTGLKTAFMPNEPVLANGRIYSSELDGDRSVVRAYGADHLLLWEIEADGRGDLILAGDQLYAASNDAITVIRLPDENRSAEVTTTIAVEGQVERLLAADDKLFAVTVEGDIIAFGAEASEARRMLSRVSKPFDVDEAGSQAVARLLSAGDAEGYAFWYGAADDHRVEALASNSPFVQLAVIDDDASVVDRLRRQFDEAGIYGHVTTHHAEPGAFLPPKYVANMVFVGRDVLAMADRGLLTRLYESVRPYGGVMTLLSDEKTAQLASRVRAMNLEQAEVQEIDDGVLVRRVGALPGSADWTHQYGDVANTIKSNDKRVKLPLGILWFGGSSNMDVLPRHGHGPPEQVVGGRLFIQGTNSLSARDVYTGRVLWKREFDDLGTFDVYYDETYENTPLNPQYNQVHIPGANGRGTNYAVTEDGVYIVAGDTCHVLNPATGETIREITLPEDESGAAGQWGYIGIYENILLAGLNFAMYRDRQGLTFPTDEGLRKSRTGFGSKSLDRAASLGLVAFDRHTGEKLWQVKALHSFWHNGIVAGGGRVYCLDRKPQLVEDALKRRGVARPRNYRIAAFDVLTGVLQWEVTDGVFGTWLGYSPTHDLLLHAGAAGSDRLYDEAGQGMAVYKANDGSLRWRKDSLKYAGPCILHNDWIITNANSYNESAGAFRLEDGTQKMIANPLTGELQPWTLTRAYGCNNVIASEHMLTFRSGAAGFYDLLGESGTGNFGGFKSGCTSNLVVAGGVLNAPDYTRTCSCAYQNQTSLAMVHMPELEFWTISPVTAVKSTEESRVKHVGINFGAPGDRRDEEGLLWLEHPPVAGPTAPLFIEVNDDARFFQHHSSTMLDEDYSWILASGVENVSEVTIGLSLAKGVSLKGGVPVSHADDDAEEKENGDVSLSSSDLKFITDELVGVRFNNISLPRGANVHSAFIQFTCDEPSEEPTSLIIAAENTGHAERFTEDGHGITSRAKTSAEVAWSPDAWGRPGRAGDAERTPDLAPLVRAVINRPDWKPGNSLAFFISGRGKRVAVSSRGGGKDAARLIMDAEEMSDDDLTQQTSNRYRVRLFFAAPQHTDDGPRQFDVVVQDQHVLKDVMLNPTATASQQSAVHTFDNVEISDSLRIRLTSKQGAPVLSGIELTQNEQ